MRRLAALIATTGALALPLAAAAPAGASTTLCADSWCAHIEGKGLHVAWYQMYTDLFPGQSFNGWWTIDTYSGTFYGSWTHGYHWHARSFPGGPPMRFSTRRFKVNQNFSNGTKFRIELNRGNRMNLQRITATIHR